MTEGMKKLLIPVAVILVCAIILTAASAGLAGTAASNAETELNEMISYLLPGGGEFEEIEYNGADSKITNVYKGEGGYVLAMTTNGYVDEIKLLVAVDNDGVVKGYTVRDIHDTYGLGLGVQDDLYFLVGLMNSKGDLAVNSNIDAVTGATISSSAVVACVNAASKYVQEAGAAGVLTGTADGFGGPITVSVTMDGDKIAAVEVVSNSETPEIAGAALEQIPAAIVAANSADVDIVSGATYTSNGIINAVKNALESAGSAGGALTGTADGFMGPITVSVTMDGDTITAVEVVSNSDTPEIAGAALEQIPAAIVAANSPDVDVVSGATYTSNGIINAVKNAISGTSPEPEPEATPEPTQAAQTAAEAYQGFGLSNTVRMGPGSDDTGTPVYSINQVFANTLFDSDGRIVAIYVDQLEYATPNYDGAEMPHFSGWPGQGGYNNDSNHDAVVDGTTPDTEEQFTEEVAGWVTKRDRGETYVMGTGTWSEQMDAFQKLFVGKTVDEVEEWFAKYCSDANGRPLKESSSGEGDAEKYAALTDDEKAMLADVTSSATMSLNDSHGDILSAIRKAYENRVPLGAMTATGMGLGLSNTVRMGPGSDDTGTPVYSINQVFANTLFDSDGRIVAIYVDQLEYATPNYDGAEMPHFSGWPGQGGYNNDSNHDAVVDGTTPDTEEQFTEEVAGWVTKRDRGETYVMGTGTWSEQMDAFQKLFVGKTVDEVEEWFAKYCSDANGRPLKESSSGEGDAEKYAALTDEEKAMLADITSSATMSLNDSHGDILSAIRASFDNMVPVDLTLG